MRATISFFVFIYPQGGWGVTADEKTKFSGLGQAMFLFCGRGRGGRGVDFVSVSRGPQEEESFLRATFCFRRFLAFEYSYVRSPFTTASNVSGIYYLELEWKTFLRWRKVLDRAGVGFSPGGERGGDAFFRFALLHLLPYCTENHGCVSSPRSSTVPYCTAFIFFILRTGRVSFTCGVRDKA